MTELELHRSLAAVPLFAGLPEDQLELLARRSRVQSYAAGELIVSEAERVRAFYLILAGQVKLYKSAPDGREQTLYVFGPGEPFCLCSVFCEDAFPANAAALAPSRILTLPADELERLSQEAPAILFNFLSVLSRRLKESLQLVESLALKEIPQRLAAFFLHAAESCQDCDGERFELQITHRELAKIIGAAPETLSRSLRRMTEDGLVQTEGKTIRLLDRQALHNLADGL